MSLFTFGFAKLKTKSSPECSVTSVRPTPASAAIGGECSVDAADPLPAILDSHSQTLSIIRDPALSITSKSLDTEITLGPIVMGLKDHTHSGRCFRVECWAENGWNTAVLLTRHIAFPVVYSPAICQLHKFEGMVHLLPKVSMIGNMLLRRKEDLSNMKCQNYIRYVVKCWQKGSNSCQIQIPTHALDQTLVPCFVSASCRRNKRELTVVVNTLAD